MLAAGQLHVGNCGQPHSSKRDEVDSERAHGCGDEREVQHDRLDPGLSHECDQQNDRKNELDDPTAEDDPKKDLQVVDSAEPDVPDKDGDGGQRRENDTDERSEDSAPQAGRPGDDDGTTVGPVRLDHNVRNALSSVIYAGIAF